MSICAITTVTLTYDGADLQDDATGLMLELVAGLYDTADVRGEDITVPGRDGKVARPRRFDHRRPLLRGFVRGVGASPRDDQADYWNRRAYLAALFDTARAPANLVAVLPNGTIASIPCRPLELAVEDVIQSNFGGVSVTLEAVQDWSFT